MSPATLYLALVYLHPGQREALRRYVLLAVENVPLERYFTGGS